MLLTSPEVSLPGGAGTYFLPGHRRLLEEHLPTRNATPLEAKGPTRIVVFLEILKH